MGDSTGIEWTDATWNPLAGCSRVSPGCDHCYAERMAARLQGAGATGYDGVIEAGKWSGRVNFVPERLQQPLRWTKPRTIFVNSMSDLFHDDVAEQAIEGVLAVMNTARHHTYQVLTKRPQRMARLLSRLSWDCNGDLSIGRFMPDELAIGTAQRRWYDVAHWLPHVWWGTSIESDRYTFRANHLRSTPAAVRFLSLEPLLGPLPSLDLTGIDWVIVGGESGPGARPMDPQWVRDIRDRCSQEGVAFLFKQWGEWLPYEDDPQPPFHTSPDGEMVDGHCLPALLTDMEPCSGGSEPGTWWWPDVECEAVFRRVGKHKAGRTLDGRTWDEYPRPSGPRVSAGDLAEANLRVGPDTP